MRVKNFSPHFYKIVSPCLLFYFFYLFVSLIAGFSIPHLGIIHALLASLLLSFCFFHATSEKPLFLALPFLVSVSTYLIFLLAQECIPPWQLYAAIGFHTALFILGVVPGLFLSSPKWKRVYFFILFFIYLLPTALLWTYFSISHSWPVPDTIIAILQTNGTEAWGYITDHLPLLTIPALLLYVLCIYLLASKIPFAALNLTIHHVFSCSLLCLASLALAFISLDNPLLLLMHDANAQIQQYQKFKELQTAKQSIPIPAITSSPNNGLFVLVIGESQNRSHMSAYGYNRDTTPWLQSKESDTHFIRFHQPYSCFVQTVQSLSYALTNKNQYNEMPLEKAVTLIEAAKAAGYDTYWISNQTRYGVWDSPTTVIATGCDHQIWVNQNAGNTGFTNFYDGKIVSYISQISPQKKTLVIVHLIGNHRPYMLRYPSDYSLYHSNDKNVDFYDNSIRYNDAVMKQLYETLQKNEDFQAMVYCSDHGEGVDEGLDHDVTTYRPSMTHIPFYMAFSDAYMQSYPETLTALRSHQNDIFTNDLLFNTMLGLMHIQLEGLYEPENDITSDTYDPTPSRFRTLFGKKELDVP